MSDARGAVNPGSRGITTAPGADGSLIGTKSSPSTTCRRGHPRTPENTYLRPDGARQCRTCKDMTNARYGRTPKGLAAHRRAYVRYNATFPGYWRTRKLQLEQQRTAVRAELARLTEEETECLKS